MRRLWSVDGVAVLVVLAVLSIIFYGRIARPDSPVQATRLGAAGAATTSRADLSRTIVDMEARLRTRPTDRDAAILMADASIRQARVTGNSSLNGRAADALAAVLADEPMDYEARRMIATVYAAQHRFPEAVRDAEQARTQRPDDPWNYGIIGDSHLEMGDYDKAFAAFQQMLQLQTSPAAYARVSYAFELQGQLEDAVAAMKLAVDASTPRDPESVAWLQAHLADLYMDLGNVPQARMAYAWGERAFPEHPFIRAGIARLKEAEGDMAGAVAMYQQEYQRLGTPDLAAALGDLYARMGKPAEAEQMFLAAEARWRAGGEEEQDHLARFLAERGRHLDEAVRLAEAGAAEDIVAQDALAWAYYKVGRLEEADRASAKALRTGTRNLELLYHAAAIRRARGDLAGAAAILDRAPRNSRRFVRAEIAVAALRAELTAARRPDARGPLLTRSRP